MDKAIIRRLERLKAIATKVAAEKARFAPYTEVRVRSISGDRVCLVHHERGNYGGTLEKTGLSVLEAVDLAREMEGAIFVIMMFSPEWVHSFYMASDLYTPEQKQLIKQQHFLLWPNEISWIYQQEAPEGLVLEIASIPQKFRIGGQKIEISSCPSGTFGANGPNR